MSDNSFSVGLTLTVSEEGIELDTASLSSDTAKNDEQRTAAVVAGYLINKAANAIMDNVKSMTPDDIKEFLKSKGETE